MKWIVVAALLSLVIFGAYAMRPDLYGYDSYYFLDLVCSNEANSQPVLMQLIILAIPCNILAIKAILFSLMLSALVGVGYLAKTVCKNANAAQLAVLFVFLSPIFISEFLKFENDQFAFPLLFFSLAFFYRKKYPHALALLAVALLIWEGAVYYLVAFALSWLMAAILLFPVLLLKGHQLVGAMLPNFNVRESLPVVAFFFLGGLIAGYAGTIPLIMPQLGFFTLLLLLNGKYVIHAVPLLAACLVVFYNDNKYDKYAIMDSLKVGLIIGAVALFCWQVYNINNLEPLPYQHEAVQFAVDASAEYGLPLRNDWSYGYWVKYHGGIPSAWGGGIWEQDFNNSVALTREALDCELLREFNEMRVYRC